MNIWNKISLFLIALLAIFVAVIRYVVTQVPLLEGPPGYMLLAALVAVMAMMVVAFGKHPPSRWRIASRKKMLFQLNAALVPLLLLFCSASSTHAATDGLTGSPLLEQRNFTNALTGVGGLHRTNTLYQFTNGSTTVTSAWVALRGKGFALDLMVSPTNALLTNIVNEFRFSQDGTNALDDPTFLWRAGGSAIAAGRYHPGTNVLEDAFRNYRYIQHWKIHLTNGVNNVGSAFSTNRSPVRVTQHYD